MQLSKLMRNIGPHVPVALIMLNSRRVEIARRERFKRLKGKVVEAVNSIAALTEAQCVDARFLETSLIPFLGLNDEHLDEQPPELSTSFGKGLHIWQYPSQLADYLVWLSRNAGEVKSYLEIGCRWGGMFILITEWIRRVGRLQATTAIDPIKPSPLIETYFELIRNQSGANRPPIQATYVRDFSTSQAAREIANKVSPDLVFIDGDHRLRGALADHMLVREKARIVVHHDVCSDACPDTTFLWETLKKLEAHEFEFFDFVSQYPSVKGNFLGIGAMKRKMYATTPEFR
jgi:hypothetical protein